MYIQLKQLGKRRPILEKHAIAVDIIGERVTLKQLIEAVVTQQVHAYNAHSLEQPLLPYLTERQVTEGMLTGKVGFGAVYHAEKADLQKALRIAIEAHIDGLFAVAVDGKVKEDLEETLDVGDDTVLTFLRLTLLTG